MSSPALTDDLPTPRAVDVRPMQQRGVPTTISELTRASVNFEARPTAQFDDLYDVTDDEAEEVPLKCSASVKKQARTTRHRYPSLIIPSPSAWPTIQKLQKSAITSLSPTGPMHLSPTPNMMSMLAARTLRVPASSATPSLDGSMTSEEMEHLSCPSTPDVYARKENDDWAVQLQPRALETLHHLSMTESEVEAAQALELPETEMEQIYHPSSDANSSLTPGGYEDNTLSPLSIPSPGGFFSSLGGSARITWSVSSDQAVPSTCVAETFYGVPWRASSGEPVPQVIEVKVEPPPVDEPPTAKLTILSGPSDDEEVTEILPSDTRCEYNPNYDEELQKMASTNLGQTESWLASQFSYLAAICEEGPAAEPQTPSTPSHKRQKSLEGSYSSPSKKSVRFLEEAPKSPASSTDETEEKEAVFVEAFEHICESARKTDAYIHRQTRADAMHIHRRHLASSHRDQLLGRYEISQIARPAPPRPVSSFYTDDPTVLKERIARAQKERQALEQVMPSAWVLQAQKFLNGGKLLSAPASKVVRRSVHARILDVGGHTTCDWAWQVAYDYEDATVYTVNSSPEAFPQIQGPSNHKTTVVPNYWTFPYPSCHFDVISLRSLYTLLKTNTPVGSRMDELDLCLKECLRCLRPGGYLDFSVLDADIIRAGPFAQAMSAEFSFNLKTRGYDPAPTKSFLARLNKAGFEDIKRSWTVLPMGQTASRWNDALAVGTADSAEKTITPDGDVTPSAPIGTTRDVSALTGLTGAWAWERWMIKLQVEMGKDEERLLEGVPAMLEEGVKTGAGWRQLTGWARKTV